MRAEADGDRIAVHADSMDPDHGHVVREFVAELHEVVR
jgi:hypothetical protein